MIADAIILSSLSHQNWRLRAGYRRDGAGRMDAEWVWRAWGPHRPALPRTFPRHHVDPGQSGGLPGEKGSSYRLSTTKLIQRASWRISRKQYYDGPFS